MKLNSEDFWGGALPSEFFQKKAKEAFQLGAAASSQQLLEAVKLAYRKHHLEDDSVGWDELTSALCDALCEAMGDAAFQAWQKTIDTEKEGS